MEKEKLERQLKQVCWILTHSFLVMLEMPTLSFTHIYSQMQQFLVVPNKGRVEFCYRGPRTTHAFHYQLKRHWRDNTQVPRPLDPNTPEEHMLYSICFNRSTRLSVYSCKQKFLHSLQTPEKYISLIVHTIASTNSGKQQQRLHLSFEKEYLLGHQSIPFHWFSSRLRNEYSFS